MIEKRKVLFYVDMWILKKNFGGGRHANMEGRILTKPHPLTKNYMQLVTTDKDVFNKDEPLIDYPTPNGLP